jgi:DNA replication protein DnaC
VKLDQEARMTIKCLSHKGQSNREIARLLLRRKKYISTSLLIIDEVGFEPMSRQEASLFFRLVSYRYQKGSILITTNKGIKDRPEVLAGDEVLATAILDRLLHNSHVIDIKGRSYRLRDLERAVAQRG